MPWRRLARARACSGGLRREFDASHRARARAYSRPRAPPRPLVPAPDHPPAALPCHSPSRQLNLTRPPPPPPAPWPWAPRPQPQPRRPPPLPPPPQQPPQPLPPVTCRRRPRLLRRGHRPRPPRPIAWPPTRGNQPSPGNRRGDLILCLLRLARHLLSLLGRSSIVLHGLRLHGRLRLPRRHHGRLHGRVILSSRPLRLRVLLTRSYLFSRRRRRRLL